MPFSCSIKAIFNKKLIKLQNKFTKDCTFAGGIFFRCMEAHTPWLLLLRTTDTIINTIYLISKIDKIIFIAIYMSISC